MVETVRVGERTRPSLFENVPPSSSENLISSVFAEPMPVAGSLCTSPHLLVITVECYKEEGGRNHLPRGNCCGEIEFLDETELVEENRVTDGGSTTVTVTLYVCQSLCCLALFLCLPRR